MKKTIVLFAFATFSGALGAQTLKESEVPSAVKTAFAKSFPTVKTVKWSKEKGGEFEAEFKNGAMEQSSNFDAAGKWLVTETEIKKKDLPAAVQSTIKAEFAGYEIEEAEKVEMPDQPVSYEVKLEKGETTLSVVITSEGKVTKKEEEKEEKEEDDDGR